MVNTDYLMAQYLISNDMLMLGQLGFNAGRFVVAMSETRSTAANKCPSHISSNLNRMD